MHFHAFTFHFKFRFCCHKLLFHLQFILSLLLKLLSQVIDYFIAVIDCVQQSCYLFFLFLELLVSECYILRIHRNLCFVFWNWLNLSIYHWIIIFELNHIQIFDVFTKIFNFLNFNFVNIGKFGRNSDETFLHWLSIIPFGETGVNICFLAESLKWIINTSGSFFVVFPVLYFQFTI